MDIDTFLTNVPVIGVYIKRTYVFWASHVAIANATHIALGLGVAFAFFSRRKKLGWTLVLTAVIMHVIAFFW